jgi:hypothetical protein
VDCPKCSAARNEARTNCASCGLAHTKMAAFQTARDAVPDALEVAWSNAIKRWEDNTRHDELLRLVGQHDSYAWAAARYREQLRATPGDPIATAQLARVRRAAEVTMMSNAATREAKTPTPYRATFAILGLLILMIIAGVVYVTARSGDAADDGRRDPTPPGQRK